MAAQMRSIITASSWDATVDQMCRLIKDTAARVAVAVLHAPESAAPTSDFGVEVDEIGSARRLGLQPAPVG